MNFFSAKENPLHAEYKQLKRQRSALNLKLDSIDLVERTGIIGKYKVSLEHCTCEKFFYRQKPCKHMYRLAYELGLFELDAEKIAAAMKTARGKNLYGCEWLIEKSVPKNFVVIDFEAANRMPDSVCQLGIAVVKNNVVTEQKNFWIRPPYENFTATEIHGITFKDVKNKPRFNIVWRRIKKYFEGQTVAAYGLASDLNYLFATLDRYKIPRPNFEAFDILENVRACREKNLCLADLENAQLVTVAKKLRLTHKAHNALSDALVTAQIQIYLSKNFPAEKTLFYLSTFEAVVESIAKDEISPEDIENYCDNALKIGQSQCPKIA